MWTLTEKKSKDGNLDGLILHSLDRVSTYTLSYDEELCLTIGRDSSQFFGVDAINFLKALESAIRQELFSNAGWYETLSGNIKFLEEKYVD